MAKIVWLMPKGQLYPLIHGMSEKVLKQEATDIYHLANLYLEIERGTTQWTKLPEPMVSRQQASGLTDIDLDKERQKYGNDYLVTLEGGEDNAAALAIEMGHSPSGYFKGSATKSPRGLYILMRAAGSALMSRKGWRKGRK